MKVFCRNANNQRRPFHLGPKCLFCMIRLEGWVNSFFCHSCAHILYRWVKFLRTGKMAKWLIARQNGGDLSVGKTGSAGLSSNWLSRNLHRRRVKRRFQFFAKAHSSQRRSYVGEKWLSDPGCGRCLFDLNCQRCPGCSSPLLLL